MSNEDVEKLLFDTQRIYSESNKYKNKYNDTYTDKWKKKEVKTEHKTNK